MGKTRFLLVTLTPWRVSIWGLEIRNGNLTLTSTDEHVNVGNSDVDVLNFMSTWRTLENPTKSPRVNPIGPFDPKSRPYSLYPCPQYLNRTHHEADYLQAPTFNSPKDHDQVAMSPSPPANNNDSGPKGRVQALPSL